MSGVRLQAVAGAVLSISTAALAAEVPPSPEPGPPVARPVVETGWYLRGDVGLGVQRFRTFDHFQTNPAFVWPASWTINQSEAGAGAFVDFGVGYALNNWLRFDVIGEQRTPAKFKALASYHELCPRTLCSDQYDGSHSARVVLANFYLDLGTWWGLTPFLGAGLGGAYNTVSSLTDTGFTGSGSTGFGASSATTSSWSFAWAAHAGLTYNISSNVKLEFAYRYLNLGSARTPVVNCSTSACQINPISGAAAFYTLTNFNSQDFKIGLRWMLQPEAPVIAPPLIRKG
jgi:opacity protein-like surface antigen